MSLAGDFLMLVTVVGLALSMAQLLATLSGRKKSARDDI